METASTFAPERKRWIVSVDPGRLRMGLVAVAVTSREVIAYELLEGNTESTPWMCELVRAIAQFIERTGTTLADHAPGEWALARVIVEHNTMSAPLYALMMATVMADQSWSIDGVVAPPQSCIVHPSHVDRHFGITCPPEIKGRARYKHNKTASVAKVRELGYTHETAPCEDTCEALLQALYYIDAFLTSQ